MSVERRGLVSEIPRATPVSRLLRFLLGVALIGSMMGPLAGASAASRLRIALVFAGLVLLYAVIHLLVTRYFHWVNPWLGALIAVTPAAVVFLGGGVYAAGVILFIGASLLLMAVLGHPGCEVLAFPSLLLGRRTHLACILFSPIDWVEGRLTRAQGARDGAA